MSRRTPCDQTSDRWANYTKEMDRQLAKRPDFFSGPDEGVSMIVSSLYPNTFLYVRYFANVAESEMRVSFKKHVWTNMPERLFEHAVCEICDMEVDEFDAASQTPCLIDLQKRASAYREKLEEHVKRVRTQILSCPKSEDHCDCAN